MAGHDIARAASGAGLRASAAAWGESGAGAGQQADQVVGDLYEANALALVRMARLLLRDQASAEDAVQDAFLGLYRALPRLADQGDLLPYVRAAVINRCRTVLRARGRARLRVLHEPDASSAEASALAGAERQAVLDAVAALPRRSREVLVLRYYTGLADAEIARTLGVSRGTVSSTASRAVAAVARALREES
jgi:RNA polymerase sigma-70 factor (sigma-E family)